MKAYFNGEEVIILEFGDNEKYGPMARVTFREPVPWGNDFLDTNRSDNDPVTKIESFVKTQGSLFLSIIQY